GSRGRALRAAPRGQPLRHRRRPRRRRAGDPGRALPPAAHAAAARRPVSDSGLPHPGRTAIRAGHVVAFDGQGHRLLPDGVVVVEGARILYVGRGFDGLADLTVEAPTGVLTPGLISTHAHIHESPLDRSFIEDTGTPQFFYSGLFEMLPVRSGAQDDTATEA